MGETDIFLLCFFMTESVGLRKLLCFETVYYTAWFLGDMKSLYSIVLWEISYRYSSINLLVT